MKEVLKRALDVLENGMKFVWTDPEREAGFVAIDAIKAALAQQEQAPVPDWKTLPPEEPPLVKWAKEQPAPVQEPSGFFRHEDVCGDEVGPPTPYYLTPPAAQEPVGQLLEDAFGRGQVMWFNKPKDESMLYTTPQQRKPLTDEQIETCYETTGHYQTLRPQDRFAVFALARAIEAKLKEKNT